MSVQGGLNSSSHNVHIYDVPKFSTFYLVASSKPSEGLFQKNHELPQNCEFFIILQELARIMKVSIKDFAELS